MGALCETAGFGASISTCWAGNLNLVSRRVAQAQEDGVGRVGHLFVQENIGCSRLPPSSPVAGSWRQ